jgi:hypothetical protein
MATGNPVKNLAHRLPLPGDWRPARPILRRRAGHRKASNSTAGRQAHWRVRFAAWRRTRPFWGGLLLVLGGLELLALPLSGILSRGAVRLVVYIGIGGVFGVLIGILLITAGIAVWVSPAHRAFYGVAGVVMGIASFPTSNLGGFFICMLLSIIGGSLAFAWSPGAAVATSTSEPAPAGPAAADAAAPVPPSPEAPTSPDLRPPTPADAAAAEPAPDELLTAPLAPGDTPADEPPGGAAPAARS